MRPKQLFLVNCISRNASFCTKQQNFALKLKAITSVGGKLSTNPETVAELSIAAVSSLGNELAVDKIAFSTWKKINIAFKKVVKKRPK